MYKVYDCDSHIEESEHVFADKYWDQRFRGRRPVIVQTDEMGNNSFIIDSISHPRIVGPASVTGGVPASRNGEPSPFFKLRTAEAAKMGHIDTLASCELHNATARLEQMDREGIAMEVNFPSLLLTWPMAHDPKIGCAVARSYNNFMADISSQAPDRLKWVTVIDPADIQESVQEIRRTKEMGSAGLMLLGSVGDIQVDDPSMEPIWAACAELEVPVAVHPGFCNPGLNNQYSTLMDAIVVPFVFSQLLGFYAVVRSGLLDRYPNLRVAFMENGSRWVDYLAMRIAETSGRPMDRVTMVAPQEVDEAAVGGSSHFRAFPYTSELMPADYIRRGQVFVNCEVDEHQLPYIVEEFGDDFLIFASDIPHGHRVANPQGKLMARTDLSEETKRKILVDNTARFYGLPVPEPELVAAGD